MTKITPTSTIAVGDHTYDVARMSEQVQQMVAMLDNWRQREADVTSELLMVRAALRDLQNTMYSTIVEERESAVKAAAALGLLPNLDSTAPVAVPNEGE